MKARSLSTWLMLASASIVTLTPNLAYASIPLPTPKSVFETAVRTTLDWVVPTAFEELGWSEPARMGLLLLVTALTVTWLLRLVKTPKEGNDTLGQLGGMILALIIISIPILWVLVYLRWGWNATNFTWWKFDFTWPIRIAVILLGIKLGLFSAVGKGLKLLWETSKAIWTKVTGAAGSGRDFAWRLLAALVVSAALVNNHKWSNMTTVYLPSILSSVLGLGVLVLGKTAAGNSLFNRLNDKLAARKAAKAQAAPVVAQATAVATVATAPPPPVTTISVADMIIPCTVCSGRHGFGEPCPYRPHSCTR